MNAPVSPAMGSFARGCSCGGAATGTCSCGSCGSVCRADSFIRPQFFAGQLLTEDDLQSLEDYALAKNRLHNQRLFGDGVVCGLTVLCNPCGGGSVLVQPGYALDCCGNDIVLPCAVELDINQMVRDLRLGKLGGYDCVDPCPPAASSTARSAAAKRSDDIISEYCLYVSYCEQPTEPVAPYAQDQPCTPAICQPSRIREGLRFELRCPEERKQPEDFLAALECCLKDVIGLERSSQDALTLEGLERHVLGWAAQVVSKPELAADLRDRLVAQIERSPHLVSCTLLERLKRLKLPTGPANDHQQDTAWREPAEVLVRTLIQILRDCICAGIIPPCRDCADTGVRLACLKIRDCEVIEICNLDRRFVVSPTALRYWFGADRIEAFLHTLCCTDPRCWEQAGEQEGESKEERTAVRAARPEPPDIARAARTVQAAVRAAQLMQPSDSPLAPRLRRIDRAFGVLGSAEPERISRPEEGVSEAGFQEIRERLQGEFTPAAELATLRGEVERLRRELAEVRRIARRAGGRDA